MPKKNELIQLPRNFLLPVFLDQNWYWYHYNHGNKTEIRDQQLRCDEYPQLWIHEEKFRDRDFFLSEDQSKSSTLQSERNTNELPLTPITREIKINPVYSISTPNSLTNKDWKNQKKEKEIVQREIQKHKSFEIRPKQGFVFEKQKMEDFRKERIQCNGPKKEKKTKK